MENDYSLFAVRIGGSRDLQGIDVIRQLIRALLLVRGTTPGILLRTRCYRRGR